MADIRTLKLALLADTKDFIKGLDKADNETRSFSDKLGTALKAGAVDHDGNYLEAFDIEHKDKHILALVFKSRILSIQSLSIAACAGCSSFMAISIAL